MVTKKQLWDSQLLKIKEPPVSKRTWHPHNQPHKLAVVLIEFRKHKLIKPVLYNNAHVHGGKDDTSLVIVHGQNNKSFVRRGIESWKNVSFIELPYDNIDRHKYSEILTKASFWQNFRSEYTLIIQTDTVTFKAIPDHFFKFAYVGAPWPNISPKRSHSRVGNGGYSLRRVKDMIEVCSQHQHNQTAEDVFFSKHLSLEVLPSVEIAKTFAVECVFYPTPCGSHQGWIFTKDKQNLIQMLKALEKFH